jgi:NADPH-dependent curcumin reductase CurA
MSGRTTRAIRLAARPQGSPAPTDFRIEALDLPELQDGQIELALCWLSLDPLIRIRIDAAPLGGSIPPMPLGDIMAGPVVSRVVASRHADFAVGDLVEGRLPWQETALSDGSGLKKVDPGIASPSTALGMLGLPGFTAYVGLRLVADVAAGGSLLVSGASGAVGSIVGQLGKLRGLRVVGLASSAEKCRYLVDELGFDAAVDRRAPDLKQQLLAASSGGFDIYFDNVGGPLFPLALSAMKYGGQVVICGLMANYGDGGAAATDRLPEALLAIMARSLTVKAFGSLFYQRSMGEDFKREVGELVKTRRIRLPEHVVDGFDAVPEAFSAVFRAGHFGKALVRVGSGADGDVN